MRKLQEAIDERELFYAMSMLATQAGAGLEPVMLQWMNERLQLEDWELVHSSAIYEDPEAARIVQLLGECSNPVNALGDGRLLLRGPSTLYERVLQTLKVQKQTAVLIKTCRLVEEPLHHQTPRTPLAPRAPSASS